MAEEITTDEQVEQSDTQPSEEASGSKKIIVKILLGVLGLLLFIFASIAISYIVYNLKDKPSSDDAQYQPENIKDVYQKVLSYDFGQDDFKISLDPKEGQTNPVVVIAKLALTYSEEHAELGQELTNRKDQMMDIIQGIIARHDPDDLKNIMFREENLSVEIISALNPLFGGKYEILGVYMPKFDVIEQKQ